MGLAGAMETTSRHGLPRDAFVMPNMRGFKCDVEGAVQCAIKWVAGRLHYSTSWKRHQQEHRPQRLTERSDPTQRAEGRTGDCPGPRKGATTRRTVTQGGGGRFCFRFGRCDVGICRDTPSSLHTEPPLVLCSVSRSASLRCRHVPRPTGFRRCLWRGTAGEWSPADGRAGGQSGRRTGRQACGRVGSPTSGGGGRVAGETAYPPDTSGGGRTRTHPQC